MIDPVAVRIFAQGGIMLVESGKHNFTWSYDGYLRSEPLVKDLEIRIHEGDYMGRIIYREMVKAVHIKDSRRIADEILRKYEGEK